MVFPLRLCHRSNNRNYLNDNELKMRASILLIAGEVSGDLHTAMLGRRLLERNPHWTLHALGGPHLRQVVAESNDARFLGDTSDCSAIGILSAAKIYFRCRRLGLRVLDFVRTHRIDAVVLCDWGGFNGRLLPHLHRLGIPVLYYFPPRSWQKTGSAGLDIARYVTGVATPFQWSALRLKAAGCTAEWVGHPLMERLSCVETRRTLRTEFGIQENERLVALLPGSRRTELRTLAPRLAESAQRLKAKQSLRFIAVVPKAMEREARALFPTWIPVLSDRASDVLAACDAAIVKMGTATVEAALADAPQVAVYDVSLAQRLEWYLLWAWKRIGHVAMPNIILQRGCVPELLGPECRPDRLEETLLSLLNNAETRNRMLAGYAEVRRALGSELPSSATERTAELVEEIVAGSPIARAEEPFDLPEATESPVPMSIPNL
jgi:lipid-A-disaccharide synthase